MRFCARNLWAALLALLLSCNLNLASAQNKVLDLDGNGSYVELPPDIFTNLAQATIEVWAKWDSFRTYSRVFEFGAPWQSMSLFNHERTPDLRFNVYPESARQNTALMYTVRAPALLRTNEWIHIAALSGPGGMRLYANGTAVGAHTNAASFADILVSHTNLFGRGLVKNPGDQDFRGQIDEVRVWDHRRTQEEIRNNMYKRLTGKEPGLVALWNFDDGTANDCSTNAFPGKFIGSARVLPAQILPPSEPAQSTATSLPPAPAAASRDFSAWWVAGALTLIVVLLAWLVLMLRRSHSRQAYLMPVSGQALLTTGAEAASEPGSAPDQSLKQRALAELTEFAKESLVQGLYSQRKALLETQESAHRQLAELEARLSALHLPDRIQAYEQRIAELEKELETRSGEVHELTSVTLLLLRRKLEEEKQLERKAAAESTLNKMDRRFPLG